MLFAPCIPQCALNFPVEARMETLTIGRRAGRSHTGPRSRSQAWASMAMLLFCPGLALFAQGRSDGAGALPDAPLPTLAVAAEGGQEQTPPPASQVMLDSLSQPIFKIGPWRDPKSLDLSMPVVPLSAADKLRLSFQEQLTPFALASTVFAAGWEQLRNSNPKYGHDGAAFGLRVGAAALRQTSQTVFSDGVYAGAFRQDPRYYRLARGTLGHRILYAASRTWRTRGDSGAPEVNYSLLFGHATAQALTLTYYPDRSQTGRVAVTGFGWSLVGNMLGNQYHEFWPDILQTILRKPPAGPKPASPPAHPRPVPGHQ